MLPNQPPFTIPAHLLFYIFLLHTLVFSYQQVCNHKDESALITFSEYISASSSPPLNWSSPARCCLWEGVVCDKKGTVTHLRLPSRGLKGVITSSIITLVNLRTLDLSLNSIHGSIPQDIGNLLYLEKLILYQNNLSGPIPSSLMYCTHLVEILLRDNHLNGDISKLDFSRLALLQKLDFRNNSLNGSLPQSIYSCKSVVAIGVARNILTGQISPKIVELKSLSFISLTQNSFTNITGTLRLFAKCKSLTSLFLSFNFFGESLPVHKNFIRLGEFQKLQFFTLRNCKFEAGVFPNWLSSLKSLCSFNLEGNRIVGAVPNWLGTLPKLSRVGLKNNSLLGEIPLKLCQLPALFSQNVLADSNPSQFELPVLLFRGNIHTYIRFKDDYYRGLDLSYNAFSGTIPEEIGNLLNLEQLDLSNNHFSGHIPTSIANLKRVEVINLSRNNLMGQIPILLESLSFLSHFDVSYNDLKGPIPSRGQFSTFQESNFEGNPDLCGELLNHPCSNQATSKVIDVTGSHHNMQWFLDGLIAGIASGFSGVLIVIASCAWFKNCKGRRPSSTESNQ